MHLTSFTWPGIRCRVFCQLMVGGDLLRADSHFYSYACQAVNLVSGFLSHTVGLINETVILYCPPTCLIYIWYKRRFGSWLYFHFQVIGCHENTFIVASFYFVIAPVWFIFDIRDVSGVDCTSIFRRLSWKHFYCCFLLFCYRPPVWFVFDTRDVSGVDCTSIFRRLSLKHFYCCFLLFCYRPPFDLYLIHATFRESIVLPFSGDCHENTFILASFYFVIAPPFDLYLICTTFR
jgi:hypothetical protein